MIGIIGGGFGLYGWLPALCEYSIDRILIAAGIVGAVVTGITYISRAISNGKTDCLKTYDIQDAQG